MVKTNYCSLFPDSWLGAYHGDICKEHDEFYQSDPKVNTRKEADRIFFERLKERHRRLWSFFIPHLMYLGVRILPPVIAGWERWKYNWYFFGLIPIKRREYR